MTDEKPAASAAGVSLFKAWKEYQKRNTGTAGTTSCYHTGFSDAGRFHPESESLKLRAKLRANNAQTPPKIGEHQRPESK